jgi:hypothetical protein
MDRMIRPYEPSEDVRLGWLESNANSVSRSLLDMTGFFDDYGEMKVYDGEKIVKAKDAQKITFYPPRKKDLMIAYNKLIKTLQYVKTRASAIKEREAILSHEIEEIRKDESLTEEEKESMILTRERSIKRKERLLMELHLSHININARFNALIEILASNTVETVINEHASKKYEIAERAFERQIKYEEG